MWTKENVETRSFPECGGWQPNAAEKFAGCKNVGVIARDKINDGHFARFAFTRP